MISVAATTGLPEAIATAGADPDRVLRETGLERSVLSNGDGFIACATFGRLLEEAARATADDCFGLHFGERFNPRDVGALAYVVLNSPTIAAALENFQRYLHIHNEAASVSFVVVGERGHFRYQLADLAIDSQRQHNEYAMAVLLKSFRILAGSTWSPKEVHFAHEAPARTSEHARIFGARIQFGGTANTVVVERDLLEQPVATADPRLYRILKQHVERILREMPRANDLVATVRRGVAEAIREGEPRLSRVAQKLSMSPRTLERRLAADGIVFKQLLDDTRRRLAAHYLGDRRHTFAEIAFLLGYSEVSAFNRAFKRWTGLTPLNYRNKRGSAAAA